MIKICDAIMGSGKTQAAINYMNEHKDEKFIYVTPFLPETERIKEGCPDLHFVKPCNKLPEFEFRKINHAVRLIDSGKNIVTTHELFTNLTPSTAKHIRRQKYTIIIDEALEVLKTVDVDSGNVEMLIEAGYVGINEKSEYYLTGKPTPKKIDRKTTSFLSSLVKRRTIAIDKTACYWLIPPELFSTSENIMVLTYLFEGQSLHSMFEIYNIPYKNIGVERCDTGTGFRFCDGAGYVPDYVSHIKDKLHIVNYRPNDISKKVERTAVSESWLKKEENAERIRKNTYNFFNKVFNCHPPRERMWSTYLELRDSLKAQGYSRGFVPFNCRATNDYRHKRCLAYLINIFMNVGVKQFYRSKGATVDEDKYALSTMIQWIWRSAIRDGKEVWLYLPSKRMRTLLENWMDSLTEGGEAVE